MRTRADVVRLRKQMEIATTFTEAGIEFVAVPVLNDDDRLRLAQQAYERLDIIEREVALH